MFLFNISLENITCKVLGQERLLIEERKFFATFRNGKGDTFERDKIRKVSARAHDLRVKSWDDAELAKFSKNF